MGRQKIPVNEIIVDERRRQVTLCKRKKGLFKKAMELVKLTGVDVAVIILNNDKAYGYSNRNVNDIVSQYSSQTKIPEFDANVSIGNHF